MRPGVEQRRVLVEAGTQAQPGSPPLVDLVGQGGHILYFVVVNAHTELPRVSAVNERLGHTDSHAVGVAAEESGSCCETDTAEAVAAGGTGPVVAVAKRRIGK